MISWRRNKRPIDTRETLEGELKNINTALMARWPFLQSLLRRCRIVADTNVETACVNAKGEMRVNPEFLKGLNTKAKVLVYLHEALHIALLHPVRINGKDGEIYDIAADSVVNTILAEHDFSFASLPFKVITANDVAQMINKEPKEVVKMSAEEQYYWLMKCEERPQFENIMKDLSSGASGQGGESSSDGENEEHGGEGAQEFVLQEGDAQAYSADKTPQEHEQYWRESITQSLVQAKLAGKLPSGVERIVEGFLKPKVDWKSLIKKHLLNGIGANVILCWKRPSRRHPLIPGVKRLTRPKAWFAVDTSGSISNDELQQFFGEMNAVMRNQGQGIIIPWDAQVYDSIDLKSSKDLARRIGDGSIKGGGGTVIAPALEKVINEMRQGDIVIITTDGYIHDIAEENTQPLLSAIGKKSSTAVFATTGATPILPQGWHTVKIEI
jgi:predicted metal-dependent peptidase